MTDLNLGEKQYDQTSGVPQRTEQENEYPSDSSSGPSEQVKDQGNSLLIRPTDEEVLKIRALLGRLQVEVCAQKRDGVKEIGVTLTPEEIELLAHLMGRGLIRPPSSYVLRSEPILPIDMSLKKITSVVQSLRGKSNWPVNLCFQNLRYKVKVSKSKENIQTVGTQFLHLFDPIKMLFRGCSSNKEEIEILKDISGVFKAGTSTLVLGPPGSGVTTLFKALSGVLVDDTGNSLEGKVLYSGHDRKTLFLRKLAQYIDQVDNHLPILTVRETLEFAFRCFGASEKLFARDIHQVHKAENGAHPDELVELLNEYPDFILKTYGLRNCADTVVGNELIRGISGGERKRVTTTEMLMARKPLCFFDQISTGLDSAATYDVSTHICTIAQALNFTMIVSLLQPPPKVFDLFDEVLILAEGRLLYHGKRENVLPFFESIGFSCPESKDIADFVQEIATSERDKYSMRADSPRSNQEIEAAWSKSEFSTEKKNQIEFYSNKISPAEDRIEELFGLNTPTYANSLRKDIDLVFKRQWKLFVRNKAYIIVRTIQATLLGIVIGTVFLNIGSTIDLRNVQNAAQRYGLVFNMCLQSMLSGMAAVTTVVSQRPVYYKQSKNYFFRTLSFVLADIIVGMPLQIIETFLNTTLVFWLANLVPREASDSVSIYFQVMIILVVLNLSFGSWLRVVASFSSSQGIGQVFAGITISFCILTSGFTITVNNIPGYFVWIYWINPLAWTMRSIMILVFSSSAFDEEEREFGLDLFAFQTEYVFVWTGFSLLLMYIITNVAAQIFFLEYFRMEPSGARQSIDSYIEQYTDETDDEHVNLEQVEKVNLAFRNLSYSVTIKGQNVDLLKDISGYAKAGTATALMGSSGAGKTTLMDVIAGRKTSGSISGEIFVNGRLKDKKYFARVSAYVEQTDIHSPHATVEEALKFSAFLRQPESVTYEKKARFIEQIIDTLELGPIRTFEIGFKTSGGLSTEQAKRVTIGVELAANPSVIFLDEPTSGLDSKAALTVMRGIKRVATSGRTVICTIHQPNRSIFESFDRLLLLRRGGRVIYFGDIGPGSNTLLSYFEGIPGTKSITNPRYNPATYILEVIGAGTNTMSLVDYASEYTGHPFYQQNVEAIDKIIENDRISAQPVHFKQEYAASFWTQQKQLLVKCLRTYWRSPNYNFVRVLVLMFMALLWGFAFFQAVNDGLTETTTIQSLIGVIFMALIFIGIINMNTTIPHVMSERAPYYRERASKMYSAAPYAIAVTLAELPYLIASSFLFMVIYYFLIGFIHDVSKLLLFWWLFFLYVTFATFYGQMLAVLLPNQQVAIILAGLSSSMFSLFCGFIIAVEDIPSFWQFMTYIVPARYALNALVAIQVYCPCDFIPSGNITRNWCGENLPGCDFVDIDGVNLTAWAYVQDVYGFTNEVYVDMGALLAFIIGIRTTTGFGWTYVSHLKR